MVARNTHQPGTERQDVSMISPRVHAYTKSEPNIQRTDNSVHSLAKIYDQPNEK